MEERSSKPTEVVVGIDDVRNVRDFFGLFKVEMTPELDAVLKAMEEEGSAITLERQEKFRVALCDAMVKSEHPMFKDELFQAPIQSAQRIVYEASFEEALVDAVGTEE